MAITEATVRELATSQSYEKGEDYYYTNSVLDIEKRGDLLIAQVEGSSYEPYEVTVELGGDEILDLECSCPYDWGGICKHLVAVLLAYIRQPKQIEERPSATEILADASDADVRSVLLKLLDSEPHLLDRVEAILATLAAQSQTSAKKAKTSGKKVSSAPKLPEINPSAFRRQVQQAMRAAGYGDYYNAGWDLYHRVSELVKQAQPVLDSGDGKSTLAILEAIIDPLMGEWYNYDHEGEVSDAFVEAGALLTEAFLSTDLSKTERKKWIKRLNSWEAELSDYGIDGAFEAAVAAVEQGWDYPPLLEVLQGNISQKGAWKGEAPYYADELSIARLHVLERQGRTQEYLYLAEAEGQTALYLTMLVKSGRGADAVEYAMQYAGSADEILALAQALYTHEQQEEAIKISEYGLTLHSETADLARWLRDAAQAVEQPDIALKAAIATFERTHMMDDYEATEKIAGNTWDEVKPVLLKHLKKADYAFDRIDIYLREGMEEDAMKAVDRQDYVDYSTVEKVVEVVWQTHPDWTIKHCKQQAEPIMDQGKSKYYHHAARWVERAGKAYLAANRRTEWHAYLEGLIQKHVRKYSLRPMLEELRKLSVA